MSGNMKKRFSGYFQPSASEFNNIWDDCLFVLDSNVLLSLYEYSYRTRRDILKAFRQYKKRFWIPTKVAEEFLVGRYKTLSVAETQYDNVVSELKKLNSALIQAQRHPHVEKKLLSKYIKVSEMLIAYLDTKKREMHDDISSDHILQAIIRLYETRICEPLSSDQVDEIYQTGKSRYENRIPPGYEDSQKNNSAGQGNEYGDLFIWYEIINLGRAKQKDVVFVTNDKKSDWWWKRNDKLIGPRPELRREYNDKTDKCFYMYTHEDFLQNIKKRTQSNISRKALQEVETKDWINIGINIDAAISKIPLIESINRMASVMQEIANREDIFKQVLGRLSLPIESFANRSAEVQGLVGAIKENSNRDNPQSSTAEDAGKR